MSQTSYSFYQGLPFAGVLGDYASDSDIRSRVSEEATLGMPFGIAVGRGAADNGIILLADANTKIDGLLVHTHAVEPFYAATSPAGTGVSPKGTGSVLKKGRMYVLPEVAVVPGNDVYARYTASGGNTQKGALRTDADTAKATQITQAVWESTAAAATPALVDVNIP